MQADGGSRGGPSMLGWGRTTEKPEEGILKDAKMSLAENGGKRFYCTRITMRQFNFRKKQNWDMHDMKKIFISWIYSDHWWTHFPVSKDCWTSNGRFNEGFFKWYRESNIPLVTGSFALLLFFPFNSFWSFGTQHVSPSSWLFLPSILLNVGTWVTLGLMAASSSAST